MILLIASSCNVMDAFSVISTKPSPLYHQSSRSSNSIDSCASSTITSSGWARGDKTSAAFSTSKVNSSHRRHHNIITILKGSSKEDGNAHNKDDEEEEEPQLVTREMLLRDMLSDPKQEEEQKASYNKSKDGDDDFTSSPSKAAKVKRKKKNGSSSHYRTLDNRDSLPFLVRVATPDPYTSNEQMKKEAKLNTERAKKKLKKNGSSSAAGIGKMRHNLVGMDGKDSISSSIYARADDGSMHKIIGEFALDKSTNCGDIIEVGDGTQYQVQKARCQYKYVGGKRFVMTRKILEVKEIKRILIEKEVRSLFEKELRDAKHDDEGGLGGYGHFLE